MPQYNRPPITEAVIEIRFEQPLPKDLVDAVHKRLKAGYEFSDQLSKIDFTLDVTQVQATVDSANNGYKLTNADRTDILQIMPGSFACSRFAPYNGWENFRDRVASDWKKWKRAVGYRKIQRVGVRYINRIDIPTANNEEIKIEDYLMVYPQYPELDAMAVLSNYTMQLVGPLGEDDLNLTINSRAVLSPLVGYSSLLLDIDVVREVDVPQKDDEIWTVLDAMRVHKNRIFESCVTDNARKLFAV